MGRLLVACTVPLSLLLFSMSFQTVCLADDEGKQAKPASHLAGFIYLNATLETKLPGEVKGERVVGIIAIDPNTSAWRKVADDGVRGRASPDGKLLAFAKDRETWVILAARSGGLRKVCNGVAPVWSPDGKQLVTHKGELTERKGWTLVNWRINADGSGRTKLPIPTTDEVDDWSPDGNWFATTSDRHPPHGYGYQIYVMRPDGSQQKRLTTDGLNCYPRFSPDSKKIIYFHSDRRGMSIRTVDVDGGNEKVLVDDANGREADSACWSPDGRHVVAVCFNYDQQGGGRGRPEDPDKARYRLLIISTDGASARELKLSRAKVFDLGHCPDWK